MDIYIWANQFFCLTLRCSLNVGWRGREETLANVVYTIRAFTLVFITAEPIFWALATLKMRAQGFKDLRRHVHEMDVVKLHVYPCCDFFDC